MKLVNKTYLITYSRANESICPDRGNFIRPILESFQNSKSLAKVPHWAVCREPRKSKGISTTCASSLIVTKDRTVQNNIC